MLGLALPQDRRWPGTRSANIDLVAVGRAVRTAIVTLQALTLAISPITRRMRAGAYAQFTASFTNAPSTAVTWKVNGIVGGNAAVGTVSVSGLYKAPPLIPTTIPMSSR